MAKVSDEMRRYWREKKRSWRKKNPGKDAEYQKKGETGHNTKTGKK